MDSKTLWRAGTVAHYIDADYYDQTYRRRSADKGYYADFAGGSMLELGSGTGRITFAVAEALARRPGETSILGIESMTPMRQRAAARLAKKPRRVRDRVRFEDGDFRSLDLGERFDQIIAPFNALMHLYSREDIESTLEGVRRHLKPGGLFRFDVLLPDPDAMGRDPSRLYKGRNVRMPSNGEMYRYAERFRYDAASQVMVIEMIFTQVSGEDVIVVPLAHRQFFPAELRGILHHAGFDVVAHEGDFDGEALDADAESQVLVCRAR